MPKPLVTLDDRMVLSLLNDKALLARIPPLSDAAKKYAASPKSSGCGRCPLAKARAEAAGQFTLAHVKTTIGTLSAGFVQVLKQKLDAVRYRITYVSPGGRLIVLTV